MQILYYVWNEFTGEDTRQVMRELGHEVREFRHAWNLSDDDPDFEKALNNEIATARGGRTADCVFTWNFFPIISRVCHRNGIPYVSWVFDSPHFPLASVDVDNPENIIWLFDRGLYSFYRDRGTETIRYSPLAVNGRRLDKVCRSLDAGGICYEHDVSFVGNLYDNEYNFYDFTRRYMPDELGNFFENILKAQCMTYDIDLIGSEEIVSSDKIREFGRYMKFRLDSARYDFDEDVLIRDILKKKVTQDERRFLLEDLAQKFRLALYTKADGPTLDHVLDMGQVDYMNKMPHVFHRSKINLNFMMRSIRTGMSLRVMDVLGAGGFLLTTWRSELEEYFEDGTDLVIAHSPEEVTDLIRYYLSHDSEREEVARHGHETVLRRFDYRDILPVILAV
jgi:spore maturation protein CgeB